LQRLSLSAAHSAVDGASAAETPPAAPDMPQKGRLRILLDV
jgi:hypothetical protein